MPRRKAPDSVSFNVRLSADDHRFLQEEAARHGVEVAQMVRWAVSALRAYIEANGGRIHLPIDLRELYRAQPTPPWADRSALNEDPPEVPKRRARA